MVEIDKEILSFRDKTFDDVIETIGAMNLVVDRLYHSAMKLTWTQQLNIKNIKSDWDYLSECNILVIKEKHAKPNMDVLWYCRLINASLGALFILHSFRFHCSRVWREKKTAVMGFLMSKTEVFLVSYYYYGNRMVNLIVVL